jgi:hypothetical protein
MCCMVSIPSLHHASTHLNKLVFPAETLLEHDTKPVKLLVTRFPAPATSRQVLFTQRVHATGDPISHSVHLAMRSSTSTPSSHTPSLPVHITPFPRGGRPCSLRPQHTLASPPPSKHRHGSSWTRSPTVLRTTIPLRRIQIPCLTAL